MKIESNTDKTKSVDDLILEWMKLFNDISFNIVDFTKVSVAPGSFDLNSYTSEGVCGIVIPLAGKAIYEVEGVEYLLEVGKILHAGYKMRLNKKVVSNVHWEFILIHYRLETYSPLKYQHFCLDIDSQYRYQITDIAQKLNRYVEEDSVLYSLYAKATFYELVAKIFELAIDKKIAVTNNTIRSIASYIDGNLEQNYSVQELAERCNLDETQFAYLFKKEMGISVKQYMQLSRINKAKILLRDTELPVYEVSFEIGLSDPLYFSRVFKKYTGMSPLEYRNSNLSI